MNVCVGGLPNASERPEDINNEKRADFVEGEHNGRQVLYMFCRSRCVQGDEL